jgi:O-methyltransferase involved in polyketide biosynthesis
MESSSISPTAHYTGHVWYRNGLSHPELATLRGRAMYEGLRPLAALSSVLGGASLEGYLLARHRALDAALEDAISTREVTQVVEVACGLSPRGWRFAKRHGDRITYVEADLPDLAAAKRAALERMGSLSAHHRVEAVDALRADGPGSLAALAAGLRQDAPTAIVTEGLLSYLETADLLTMWRRFADALRSFPTGMYFAELHLGTDMDASYIRAFRRGLAAFVRGPVNWHFADAEHCTSALREAGFEDADVRRADTHVHVIEGAVTSRSRSPATPG